MRSEKFDDDVDDDDDDDDNNNNNNNTNKCKPTERSLTINRSLLSVIMEKEHLTGVAISGDTKVIKK